MMLPYQERVVAERDELNDKIIKLFMFIGGPVYGILPEDERYRLLAQLRFMGKYRDVLDERIAAFEVK